MNAESISTLFGKLSTVTEDFGFGELKLGVGIHRHPTHDKHDLIFIEIDLEEGGRGIELVCCDDQKLSFVIEGGMEIGVLPAALRSLADVIESKSQNKTVVR
ncbi:MAG TPA: hypothetical protein VGP72_16610 [Planctomycetota bacterium]